MSHSSLYHPSWCSWEKVTCVMCNAQWESSSSTVRIKKLRNINYGHRDEPLCATVHCSLITVGPNCKNLPKIGLKKIDWFEAIEMTGNRNYVNLLKLKPYLFTHLNPNNAIISWITSWTISWQIIPYNIERR